MLLEIIKVLLINVLVEMPELAAFNQFKCLLYRIHSQVVIQANSYVVSS